MSNHQEYRDQGLQESSTLRYALEGVGLDTAEALDITSRVDKDIRGLALYGSRARGDDVPGSDFDLLRLSNNPHSTVKSGRASISCYTEAQLESATGTLFGTHLKRDSIVIWSLDNRIQQIIDNLLPADPVSLINSVRKYTILLTVSPQERADKFAGLVRLTRYLLRTAIYARAMLDGPPCFSVRELATRFNEPRLATLLASDTAVTGLPTPELLEELTSRLREEIGDFVTNSDDTLYETAVAHWERDRFTATMAIRATGEVNEDFDYSDLPKIML